MRWIFKSKYLHNIDFISIVISSAFYRSVIGWSYIISEKEGPANQRISGSYPALDTHTHTLTHMKYDTVAMGRELPTRRLN